MEKLKGAIFEEKISGPGEFVTFMRHSCRPNCMYWYTCKYRVIIWAREKNITSYSNGIEAMGANLRRFGT